MKVAIIGAGATGLVSAYLLARQGHDVTIAEASDKAGGLLSTFDFGNGTRLEYFYHHFFTHDAEINWLLKELDLSDQVKFLPTTMGMYRDGTIQDFNGIKDLLSFSAIPLTARLRFAMSSAMLVYLNGYDEAEQTPCLSWFEKWAGRAATDAIWRPMLEVKFGDAAERIPLAWMTGRLRQRARSRSGTQEKLGYLDGSLQVLVDRLVQGLADLNVDLRLETPIESLQFDAESGKSRVCGINTNTGQIKADQVLSTIPTPILANLLQTDAPEYSQQLDRIRYMGAICTILSLDEPLSPVYWLNVADPGYDFGGVIEQTNLVPAEHYGGQHITYLSKYVEWDSPLWNMSDDDLYDRQIGQLGKLFGADIRNRVQKHWVFRGKYAAPVCEIGFRDLIPRFQSPIENLYVASMPHVYPDERSVNNSIRVAAEVLAEMGHSTGEVPRNMSLAAKYGHK